MINALLQEKKLQGENNYGSGKKSSMLYNADGLLSTLFKYLEAMFAILSG